MIQYKEPIIYPNHSIDNSEDLDIEIEYEHDINKKLLSMVRLSIVIFSQLKMAIYNCI